MRPPFLRGGLAAEINDLWNVHYAPLIENTIDKVKYVTPIPIPGAVSLSLDV